MAINIPDSATEVVQRAKTDVQRELQSSNPFLRNSWLGAIITSIANRIYDFYIQLKEAFKQALPDTATEDYLERWAAIWGINRLAATAASGNVVATGTATTNIPSGTLLATSDGKVYESTASVVITASVVSVSSITRSGTTATVTTASNHGLASNVPVTIAGADQAEYNLTDAVITVTGLNTFTYEVTGAPASPATGTITATFTAIQVPVDSQDFGIDQNQDPDAILSLQSPIAGVDDDMYADWGELGGGSDQESDAELKARLLDRIQNPIAHFNVAEITAVAKTVNGVTRVFVQEATPAVGQVTIYFMRDDDPDPIPDASEIAAVDAVIQAIRPANTAAVDVIVGAPTGVPVAFTFTALSPNTSTMKTAISANLAQFFDEQTEVGVNITEDAFRSAIFNTIDTETGDEMESFTLSTPAADVVIASGEIGTLGTITYP